MHVRDTMSLCSGGTCAYVRGEGRRQYDQFGCVLVNFAVCVSDILLYEDLRNPESECDCSVAVLC